MPKRYFCDYCSAYLTHDSPSVRKTHNSGRKHKDHVRMYYEDWLREQSQAMLQGGGAGLAMAPAVPAFRPPRPLLNDAPMYNGVGWRGPMGGFGGPHGGGPHGHGGGPHGHGGGPYGGGPGGPYGGGPGGGPGGQGGQGGGPYMRPPHQQMGMGGLLHAPHGAGGPPHQHNGPPMGGGGGYNGMGGGPPMGGGYNGMGGPPPPPHGAGGPPPHGVGGPVFGVGGPPQGPPLGPPLGPPPPGMHGYHHQGPPLPPR